MRRPWWTTLWYSAVSPRIDLDAAPVAEGETAAAGEHGIGERAGADHHSIGVDRASRRRDDGRYAAVGALEALELIFAVDDNAVIGQALLEEPPGPLPERPAQDHRFEHHDRAGAAELGERGGDLGTDVRAPDQHHPLARGIRADRVGVAERAQVVDALELGARYVQPPHVRAGRDQGFAEADLLAVGELGRARGRVKLHRRAPRQNLDLLLGVPLRGLEQRVLARLGSAQVLLRARRPVVGQIGFAPDEQDLTVRPRLTQPARAIGGGETSADQQVIDIPISHPGPRRSRRTAA
jgi:hypothetical protein